MEVFFYNFQHAVGGDKRTFSRVSAYSHLHGFAFGDELSACGIMYRKFHGERVTVVGNTGLYGQSLAQVSRAYVFALQLHDRPDVAELVHRRVTQSYLIEQSRARQFEKIDIVAVPNHVHGVQLMKCNSVFYCDGEHFGCGSGFVSGYFCEGEQGIVLCEVKFAVAYADGVFLRDDFVGGT